MPIKIRCKGCGAILSIAERKKGQMMSCLNCNLKFIVPESPSSATAEPRTNTRKKARKKKRKSKDQKAKEDREAFDQKYAEAPRSNVRCHNCGNLIAEGYIYRANIRITTIEGPHGLSGQYGMVSLCPYCYQSHASNSLGCLIMFGLINTSIIGICTMI